MTFSLCQAKLNQNKFQILISLGQSKFKQMRWIFDYQIINVIFWPIQTKFKKNLILFDTLCHLLLGGTKLNLLYL